MEDEIENLTPSSEPEPRRKILIKFLPVLLVILVLVLGITTGYFFSLGGRKSSSKITRGISQKDLVKGKEFGAKNASKDTAIGVLEKGGLDGEGTHRLLREGGPSQTLYLTSSVLDLDQFVGKKIQIWGETYKAQKAGWFMDLQRLKILE